METRTLTPTEQLQVLMKELVNGRCTLEGFKTAAMQLVSQALTAR
jgi:hypothetical protein